MNLKASPRHVGLVQAAHFVSPQKLNQQVLLNSILKTACPHCKNAFETPYTMLGAAADCPVCLRSVIPYVPIGTSYPRTGYEITFQDFCQLITEPEYCAQVLPHLREWFGYDAAHKHEGFFIIAADGSSVPPLTVHQSIQSDSRKQYALYQTAMSLWR